MWATSTHLLSLHWSGSERFEKCKVDEPPATSVEVPLYTPCSPTEAVVRASSVEANHPEPAQPTSTANPGLQTNLTFRLMTVSAWDTQCRLHSQDNWGCGFCRRPSAWSSLLVKQRQRPLRLETAAYYFFKRGLSCWNYKQWVPLQTDTPLHHTAHAVTSSYFFCRTTLMKRAHGKQPTSLRFSPPVLVLTAA